MKHNGDQGTFQGYQQHQNPPYGPKDRNSKLPKNGVIYEFKLPHINCQEYIGKSGRTFGNRLKEHLWAPFLSHHHKNSTGHPVSPECFIIFDREPQGVTGNIKETIYIHVSDPSLNRSLGKYQLPHIRDQVLQDTPALQLKYPSFTSPYIGQSTFLQQLWGNMQQHCYILSHVGVPSLFTPLLYHTSPQTPIIPKIPQTALLPHFHGTIIGKCTY